MSLQIMMPSYVTPFNRREKMSKKSVTTNNSLGEIHNGLAGIETGSTGTRNEGLELKERARHLAKAVAM